MENISPEVEITAPKKNILFEVTPFSKVLAAVLFISLPFVGFWIGTKNSLLILDQNVFQPENATKTNVECNASSSSNNITKNTEIENSSTQSLYYFQTGVLFDDEDDVEQSASIVYDKDRKKLVTNSLVTDDYFRNTNKDEYVESFPINSSFVINVPQESVIFKQEISENENLVYVSVLRTDKLDRYKDDIKMGVFVYNILEDKVTFKMSVPAFSNIHSFSNIEGDELVAITLAGCYPCGGSPESYFVIDLKSGNIPSYKSLGRPYSFNFTSDRTYTYTTLIFRECVELELCLDPGETFTETFTYSHPKSPGTDKINL